MYYKTIFFILLPLLLSCKKYDNGDIVEAQKTGYDISDESFENAGLSVLLAGQSEWKNYKAEFVNFNAANTEMKIVLVEGDNYNTLGYIVFKVPDVFKNKTYYVNSDERILSQNEMAVKLFIKQGKQEFEYTGITDSPVNYVAIETFKNAVSRVRLNFSAFMKVPGLPEVNIKGNFIIKK